MDVFAKEAGENPSLLVVWLIVYGLSGFDPF
jgi:hypothetical protein